MRSIDDILKFRGDISPFLVHLTKTSNSGTASEMLGSIIQELQVRPGSSLVSDLRFGGNSIPEDQNLRFLGGTCFTETPLGEVHCLLDIQYRKINLEPYGLVFLKDRLLQKEVSPVFYLNNHTDDKDDVARSLYQLAHTNAQIAERLLPLFSVFGNKLTAPNAQRRNDSIDFRWEREWRQPYYRGGVQFTADDVFVGLCPHEEIGHFEQAFAGVLFIDPLRPLKWYATSLIQARQRVGLKASVV